MVEIEYEVWAGDYAGKPLVTRMRTLPTKAKAETYLANLDLAPKGRQGMRIVEVTRKVVD